MMKDPTVCVQMADQDTESCSMDPPLVIQEHPPPTGIRIKLSCSGPSKFQATLIHHPDKEVHLASQKKARKGPSPDQDPEILDMIRGRPEDDQYIYLDVETGLDDDDEPFGTSTDEAWTPSARVHVRERSSNRPSRLNARRGVVETSLANAAARLHHVASMKKKSKQHDVKKRKHRKAADDVSTSMEVDLSANHRNLSVAAAGKLKEGQSTSKINPRPLSHPSRKGHKTAKQRLAKAMKISLLR